MDHDRFIKILSTFIDPGTSIEKNKGGKVLVQVRDSAAYIEVFQKHGELYVRDDGEVEYSATNWLLNRVARIPLLADRILTQIPAVPNFITPSGKLFDQIHDDAEKEEQEVTDASIQLAGFLGVRPSFTSSVVYLTSDAGEGKTSLITQIARLQAEKYKRGESDWLLVPIELGGRPFIRFDDIVVGYLTNRLRFPVFYYDAFLELVKLGIIVPAFDGFEEMFVQSQSGDAISAVGNLVGSLEEQGTVLISARKAYFEYQDLRLRSKLIDSIGGRAVAFSRLQLSRWNALHFLSYAESRGVSNGGKIYDEVLLKLGDPEHPLLTRAVLVRRLLDVAETETDLSALLAKLSESPQSFFSLFVQAIIDREAHTKWIDQGGEAAKPLLTVEEHFELLSMTAQEMWLLSTEAIQASVLETVADVFCEAKKKSPNHSRQIRERIKQHALLTSHQTIRSSYMFDHEEFRNFFLGISLARLLTVEASTGNAELLSLLRQGALANLVIEAVVSQARLDSKQKVESLIELLCVISRVDSQTSFTHENSANLILHLVANIPHERIVLDGLVIPTGVLHAIRLSDIEFRRCEFAATDTENTTLERITFIQCSFDRLGLAPTLQVRECILENCAFSSVVPANRDVAVFTPAHFSGILTAGGFKVIETDRVITPVAELAQPDEDYSYVLRVMRIFATRTFATEAQMKVKFGKVASYIIDDLVPALKKHGVLVEDTYRGKGSQRVFRLGRSMESLNQALEKSGGSISTFYSSLG